MLQYLIQTLHCNKQVAYYILHRTSQKEFPWYHMRISLPKAGKIPNFSLNDRILFWMFIFQLILERIVSIKSIKLVSNLCWGHSLPYKAIFIYLCSLSHLSLHTFFLQLCNNAGSQPLFGGGCHIEWNETLGNRSNYQYSSHQFLLAGVCNEYSYSRECKWQYH